MSGPLKNARELFRQVLGQTRPKYPAILAKLKEAGITPTLVEGENVGGHPTTHPYLSAEDYDKFRAWLIAQKTVKTAGKTDKAPVVILNEELTKWKDEMERHAISLMEEVSELRGTVDTLHKAIEAMHGAYTTLLTQIDPIKAREFAVPVLPPRYKYKIVVIGGDHRTSARLEAAFPNLKIVHAVESAGKAGQGSIKSKQTLPRGDLVLLMTSFAGHSLQDAARAHYGKENIQLVGGSVSAAEAAISMWLHEREKAGAGA